MSRLIAKVAIVTGGGSGIGRAIAMRLAREGARVVVAGQRYGPIEDTAHMISAAGGGAHEFACDVANAKQVRDLVADTIVRFGALHILVNNAAKNRPDAPLAENVTELTEEWWRATMDVNATGAFLCTKYALPHIIAAGGGAVINVASTSGVAGNWNQSAYVASKHALVGLTRSIALDYAKHGVRANAICPGFIETERSLGFSAHNRGDDWQAKKLAEIPVGRFGRVEEVAALAAFLASDEATFLTGATIPIDGGTAARRG